MKFRIPNATLPGAYQDGEILDAVKLNEIVNVLRAGVNNNYDDLIKMIAGGEKVLTFNNVAAMEAVENNLLVADNGTIAIVFDYSETETNNVDALLIYKFNFATKKFVEYYDGDEISFITILDAIAEQVTNYTAIQLNASAGAAHAVLATGSNPHATTFANIADKPTTVEGYGISDAATLVSGKVPATQLPSYVDDVIEGVWINNTTFTVGGVTIIPETGKIYVSTSGDETHKVFRWTGNEFIEVSVSLALGTTSSTAFQGDLGEEAYDWAEEAHGWGDHATVGYLTSYTEDDPIFTASNAAGIAATDIGNWDEAYGWGDHAGAGYLTSTDIGNAENWDEAYGWGDHAGAGYADGTNEADWDTAYGWGDHADAGYVVNTTNIANLPLTGDITASNLTAELDTATTETKGLMSAEDKENLDTLQALMGDDENEIVDKITEVLTIFEDYPEGADLVTALGDKLDADDERIDDWDEAYGWGDHANAGYAAGTNVSNWDTAFGWGDHANVGYLTAESDTLDTVVNRGSVTNNATINFATTSEVIFNTTSNHGTDLGKLGWNTSDQTLQVGLGNGVVLQLGQETLYVVRNATGSTILNGTPVSCTGVTPSGRLEISPSTGTIDPVTFLGIATQDINNGVNGKVTYFGYVNGLDTRGSTASSLAVGDETWAEGDKLYVHPTVAGKLTNVEPQAPKVKICVASVIIRHQSTGVLFVRPTSNLDLTKLSDVQIATPVSGEVLAYNATAGRWENAEVVSLGLNVSTSNLQNGQYLRYADGLWVNDDLTVYGSVNSVGLNMPTGFTVTNSPITNSGTLGVTYAEGYSLPTNATQDNWNAAFGYGNHQAVGYIVGLADNSVTTDNIAAWNGTTGKLLKDTGVAISSVLTSESDPVFTASNAFGITGTDKTNWNSAYSHITLTNNPHSVNKAQVGLTNVADVLQAVVNDYTATISSLSWGGSTNAFTKTVSLTGITNTDKPIIDINLSGVASGSVAATLTEWGKVYRAVAGTNEIVFYALTVPTVDIPILVKVVK